MRRTAPPISPRVPLPTAFRPIAAAVATALTLLAMLTLANAAHAATAVGLGTANTYAVLGGAGVTNTGPSVLNGDLGTFPNPSLTGFGGPPNGTVNGVIHQADAAAAQAQADLTTAYNNAAGQGPVTTLATELGGQSLVGGVYNSSSGTFGITGALTLNAQGNPNAVFIFQTASTLISASASSVNLVNGAQACNVFWKVGSSATLGTSSAFSGTIMALQSISLNNGVAVTGRLLARNASVTLINDTVTRAPCATGTTGGGGKGSGGKGKGGKNAARPNVQINGVPGPAGSRPGVGSPGLCVGSDFLARFRIHSSVAMRQVQVFLDGQVIKTTKSKTFTVTIPVTGLRAGLNTIKVRAVDVNGRSDVDSQSFRRCAAALPAPEFTG